MRADAQKVLGRFDQDRGGERADHGGSGFDGRIWDPHVGHHQQEPEDQGAGHEAKAGGQPAPFGKRGFEGVKQPSEEWDCPDEHRGKGEQKPIDHQAAKPGASFWCAVDPIEALFDRHENPDCRERHDDEPDPSERREVDTGGIRDESLEPGTKILDFFRGGAAEGDVGETEFGDEASDELREVVPKETSGDHRGDDEHRNQAQQDSEGQCGGQNGGPVLRKVSIAIAENFEPSTDGPLHGGQLADWLGDGEAEPF